MRNRKHRVQPTRSLLSVVTATVLGLVIQACADGEAVTTTSTDPASPVTTTAPEPVETSPAPEEVDEPEASEEADTEADATLAEAIAVGEAYMRAFDAYDADGARELLAEDVDIQSPAFRDLQELDPIEKLDSVVELNSVLGFRFSPFTCDLQARPAEVQPDTPLRVRCTYTMDSRLQQIVDYPPIDGGAFSLLIVDGVITQVNDQFPFLEFGPNVEAGFTEWLDAEHPEAFASLYIGNPPERYPRLSQEALDLLSLYLDEYEEWVDSQQE
jgi:hypothetical protein